MGRHKMSIRKCFAATLFLLFASFSAEAQGVFPAFSFGALTGPKGTANLVVFNGTDEPAANYLKYATYTGYASGITNAYPGVLDANGYPNNGPMAANISMSIPWAWNACTTHWILDWQGTSVGTNANPFFFLSYSPGMTIDQGAAFVASSSGSTQTNVFGATAGAGSYGGTGGRIIFHFNSCPGQNVSSPIIGGNNFPAGFFAGTWSGINNMRIYKCTNADYIATTCASTIATADASSYGGFTQATVNSVKAAQPAWLRWLGDFGVNLNNNGLSRAAYRRPVGYISYTTANFVPSQWAGAIAGTNTYTATIAGAGTTPTEGFLVQGYVPNASTPGTAVTLSLNGGTAHPIVSMGGGGQSTFVGSISGTTLTMTSVSAGTVVLGSPIYGQNVAPGTTITACPAAGCGSMTQVQGSFIVGATSLTVDSCGTIVAGTVIHENQVGSTLGTAASCTAGALTLQAPGALVGGSNRDSFSWNLGAYTISTSQTVASETISAMQFSAPSANSMLQVVYDPYLQVWQNYSAAAAKADGVPFEVMADFCAAVNANCWIPIPGYLAHDGSLTTIVNAMLGHLPSQLLLGLEYCNEVWNFSFSCTQYSEQFGQNFLGLAVAGDAAIHGFYGFQFKRYMDEIFTAFGANSRVVGMMEFQGPGGQWGNYEQARFMGNTLCGTSCSNASYQANVITGLGLADYNVAPNRPIDRASYIGGASYTQGYYITYGDVNGDQYSFTGTRTITNNFANLVTWADLWAAGNTASAFASIDADLNGQSPDNTQWVQQNLFTEIDPQNSNGGIRGNAITPIANFTANTSGTTMTLTGVPQGVIVTGSSPKIYADATHGSVIYAAGVVTNNSITVTSLASGAPNQVGAVYNLSGTVGTHTGVAFQLGNSYQQTWDQMAADMSFTTGRTIKYLQYEGGWQITGPRLSTCQSMPAGGLLTNSKYYCYNDQGPSRFALVSGYKVGDVLSYAATGLQYVVDTIAPDGTPLTGHIPVGQGGSLATSQTDVLLTGGSGINIAADLTSNGTTITAVTLYSGIVTQMIYDYMRNSTLFKTTSQNIWQDQMAFPNTSGVAQSNFAGGAPFNTPWAMYYSVLSGGLPLQSWYAFQAVNGGAGSP